MKPSPRAKPPSKRRPLIIGIAGGSGSGKTYLARHLASQLGGDRVAMISMDRYFRTAIAGEELAGDINFDHPSHLDFRTLISDVRKLRSGKAAQVPSYDFATMKQTAQSATIEPRPVVVVEGLFVLAEPIVSLCDLTCFLDVAADERLLGRILRDVKERAAHTEHVIDRYQRFVRPSYQIFVEPTMQNADVVVDFTYRRAMFTQLLLQLIQSYLDEDIDQETFVNSLRVESYRSGTQAKKGFMSMTTDIFKLAKAYPEKALHSDGGRALTSPAAESLGTQSDPPEPA